MHTMKRYVVLAPLAALSVPGVASAQNVGIKDVMLTIGSIIDSIVPLLMALAVAGFFYGILRFLLNVNNPEKKQEGLRFMLWGILALFVIVSVWGIIALLQRSFQVDNNTPLRPTPARDLIDP